MQQIINDIKKIKTWKAGVWESQSEEAINVNKGFHITFHIGRSS
jgi:hypothetical protein